MIRHPLDSEFDMLDDDEAIENYVQVVIPDDPKLDTVVDLAMQAYKQQMDDVIHVEPKNRLKYYEVAEKYLNQAKDAMHKIEMIDIEREKLKVRLKTMNKGKGDGSQMLTEEGETKPSETIDRNSLLEHAKNLKLKAVK